MTHLRYAYTLTTALFGVAVAMFFAMALPHHLHYQEQYQLFLFNCDYAVEVLRAGGVADLVGRFLTQFFLYAWVGASIIAVLMVGIQLLTYRLFANWAKGSPIAYALSFIPSILFVCFLTDENALMTLPVAVAMVLALALLVRPLGERTDCKVQRANKKSVVCSLYSVVTGNARTILALCATACIVVTTRHCYRTDDMPAPWEWVSIDKAKLQQKEEIMAYDFMARNEMWNRIIQRAQQHPPRNQVSVVALNLALSQRGMLTQHLLDFPQNGIAGLLPNYSKDSFSSLVTAEAFYRLGLINTAQRFVFESQEAIPDFQKSARCYKRLAETNLINGHYDVARKYLLALSQTFYYRSWALETLELIRPSDESTNCKVQTTNSDSVVCSLNSVVSLDERINTHPVYGSLRKMRCHDDYFFGGNTPQQILLRQLEANPDNHIAEEYLKAMLMLTKYQQR